MPRLIENLSEDEKKAVADDVETAVVSVFQKHDIQCYPIKWACIFGHRLTLCV